MEITALGSTPGENSSVSHDVVVQDWLIIGMGDSISSGEGNPDVPMGGNAFADTLKKVKAAKSKLKAAQDDVSTAVSKLTAKSTEFSNFISKNADLRQAIDEYNDCSGFFDCAKPLADLGAEILKAAINAMVSNIAKKLDALEKVVISAVIEAQIASAQAGGIVAQAVRDLKKIEDGLKSEWQDRDDHRSAWSGQALAAIALEKSDPKTSVTFVHTGKSGAEIGAIKGQLEDIAELIAGRQIDAIVISAGSNDAKFGDIVKLLLTYRNSHSVEAGNNPVIDTSSLNALSNICSILPWKADDALFGWLDVECGVNCSAKSLFDKNIGKLPDEYQDLDMVLQTYNIPANRVYITPYMDVTRDENGSFCVPSDLPGMEADEWRWAAETVQPALNRAVETAATLHGWSYIGGIPGAFKTHGYCSSDPWITSFPDSLRQQGDELLESDKREKAFAGTFHPNRRGHKEYGSQIAAALRSSLYSNPATYTPDATRIYFPAGNQAASVPHLAGLNFNGDQRYASVPHNVALNPFPLSMSLWLKSNQKSGEIGLINKYQAGSYNGYNFFMLDGEIRAWYFRDSQNYVYEAGPVQNGGYGLNGGLIADNKWHHVVFTVDASGGKLYVDNVKKTERSWTGAPGPATTTQALNFGYYPGSPQGLFVGQLHDLSLWNVALAGSAIRTSASPLTGIEAGLLGYWPFNDGVGLRAKNRAAAGTQYDAAVQTDLEWFRFDQSRFQRDVYYGPGINGTLASLPDLNSPGATSFVNQFELNQSNSGNNYGARMSGYFVPTQSGDHRFFLAADNEAELYLSAVSGDKADTGLAPVAKEGSGTLPTRRRWTGGRSGNISTTFNLTAGTPYYIEARMSEGIGNDHLAVAVQMPCDSSQPVNPVVRAGSTLIGGTQPIGGRNLATLTNVRARDTRIQFDAYAVSEQLVAGEPVAFHAEADQYLTYIWIIDGKIAGSGQDLTYIFAEGDPGATGDHNVLVEALNPAGPSPPSKFITVRVDRKPRIPGITVDQVAIPGALLAFLANASDPDGDLLTYVWEFGDGGTSSDTAPRHNYAISGSYEVKLTVDDNRGGIATISRTVFVYPVSHAGEPERLTGLGFDGVDNYVSVAHQDSLNAYPLTISARIKTTQSAGEHGMVNKYRAGSANGYNLFLLDGHIRAWYFGANGSVYDGGNGLDGGPVDDDAWHLVVFTVDASGGKLYVDGVLKQSLPWNGSPSAPTTTEPLHFGYYPGSPEGYFEGKLREVSLWGIPLNEADAATGLDLLTGAEPGLLGFWPLTEGTGATVVNATGPGDGTVSGATWFQLDGEGVSVTSLRFDGTDDAVIVPHDDALNGFPLTLTAWIKTAQGVGENGIVSKYSTAAFAGYNLLVADGHLQAWYVKDGGNYVFRLDGGAVNDGLWHHAAFTVDAQGGRLYVDGKLKHSLGWAGNPGPTTTTQPLSFGNYEGSQFGHLHGQLREVGIWNTALGPEQIRAAMSPLRGTETGLLGYWPLNETSGTLAREIDGRYKGTVAGGDWLTVNRGSILQERYMSYPDGFGAYAIDGTLQSLLQFPGFPDSPSDSSFAQQFEMNSADFTDHYGVRISGWFVPTETGNHIFYLAADDNGILSLSPDSDPLKKVQIAREPSWADRRDWTSNANGRRPNHENVSAPVRLVAGNPYYIEGVVSEGAGGDHLAVAVQMPSSSGPPAIGSSPIDGRNLATMVSSLRSPGEIEMFTGNNRISIPVKTSEGRTYSLEFSDDLKDSSWISASTVIGNGLVRVLTDPDAMGPRGFYRVLVK